MKTGPKGPSKYTQDFIEKEADALLEFCKTTDRPFLCTFAVQRGYPADVFTDMARANEKFSRALKMFKHFQEDKLIELGMNAKNPTFMIFALKNVAGWRDVTKEPPNEDLNEQELEFSEVPHNGDGKERLRQFFNN